MGASIQEIIGKFKASILNDTAFTALLLLLVAVGSFGLGRSSVAQTGPAVVAPQATVAVSEVKAVPAKAEVPASRPERAEISTTSAVPVTSGEATYVGSKNGTKFHLPNCPGAAQIKEENKVFFASKEEAYSKGYTEASNCKGM